MIRRGLFTGLPLISILIPSVRGDKSPKLISSDEAASDSDGTEIMPSGWVTVAVAAIEPETSPMGVEDVSPAMKNTTNVENTITRKVTNAL